MGDLSKYDDETIQRFWYACQKIKPYHEKEYVPSYEVLVLEEMEKRKESKMSKLKDLADIEGLDVMDLLEEASIDSVCPGICTNKDCTYTTEVEPDCSQGYCEDCDTNTVKSALVLAGVI
jgi:hypothetical protein